MIKRYNFFYEIFLHFLIHIVLSGEFLVPSLTSDTIEPKGKALIRQLSRFKSPTALTIIIIRFQLSNSEFYFNHFVMEIRFKNKYIYFILNLCMRHIIFVSKLYLYSDKNDCCRSDSR